MKRLSEKVIVLSFRRLVNSGFCYPKSANARKMVAEWSEAIHGWHDDVTDDEFQTVITEIIATQRFWPKPIDIVTTWEKMYLDSTGTRYDAYKTPHQFEQ